MFSGNKNALTPLNQHQPHRIPWVRIGCGQAPGGPRVAGPPLVVAGDPEGSRAAWRGVGRRVAKLRTA
jgi:hypothetical protein